MVTLDTMAKLMLPKEKRPKVVKPLDFTDGYALVRVEGKLEKWTIAQAKSSLGKFEGRQGSIRRSAKGRTRIMPNGYVRYNSVTEAEVVSYIVK
jgi:hypothetical protein